MLMLDAKGQVISPSLARQMMAQIALKFGPYVDHLDLWAEMHPSQIAEWEKCGIQVQDIDVKWVPHKTFLTFPLESNAHLSPTVVLIRKNHEIVAEIARLGITKWDMEEVNA